MTQEYITRLTAWLKDYIRPFYGHDEAMDTHIRLKELHTFRVQAHCRHIALTLGLPEETVALSEAAGLLHDIGRFDQYRRYRTFNDRVSVDHGHHGVQILEQTGVLSPLPSQSRHTILRAVACHNQRRLPPAWDESLRLIPAIVRDADKLDIFDIITGHADETPMQPTLELRQSSAWTPAMAASLLQNRMPVLEEIQTAGDQVLFRLSWVFDLNFPSSCRYLLQQKHISLMLLQLPPNPHLAAVEAHLMQYLEQRLQIS